MRVSRTELYPIASELQKLAMLNKINEDLQKVLLDAQGNWLVMRVVYEKTQLTWRLPIDSGKFHCCVGAKQFTKLVKPEKGCEGFVDIGVEAPKRLVVASDGIVTRMPQGDAKEFPAVITPRGRKQKAIVIWTGEQLRRVLEHTGIAVSSDETRYNLCYAAVNSGEAIATDGHRLHLAKLPPALKDEFKFSALAIKTLLRIVDPRSEVAVAYDKDKGVVSLSSGPWILDYSIEDSGTFPDYSQVIPQTARCPWKIVVNKSDLDFVLGRYDRLDYDAVTFVISDGALVLRAIDDELGESEASIDTEIDEIPKDRDGEVETLTTGFNPRYVIESIKHMGERLEMNFSDELTPMRVDCDDLTSVVMPLRL